MSKLATASSQQQANPNTLRYAVTVADASGAANNAPASASMPATAIASLSCSAALLAPRCADADNDTVNTGRPGGSRHVPRPVSAPAGNRHRYRIASHAAPALITMPSDIQQRAGVEVNAMQRELSKGEVAKRSGAAVSALHFYARKGLIRSLHTAGNQRRYARNALRRILAVALLLACVSSHALAAPATRAPAPARDFDPLALFAPLQLPDAPNAYRIGSGVPGPLFWRNRADHDLNASIDPVSQTLAGDAAIH